MRPSNNSDFRHKLEDFTGPATKPAVYKKRAAPKLPAPEPDISNERPRLFGKKKAPSAPKHSQHQYNSTELVIPKLNPVKEMQLIGKNKSVEVNFRNN